jgi:hypothetical protein
MSPKVPKIRPGPGKIVLDQQAHIVTAPFVMADRVETTSIAQQHMPGAVGSMVGQTAAQAAVPRLAQTVAVQVTDVGRRA